MAYTTFLQRLLRRSPSPSQASRQKQMVHPPPPAITLPEEEEITEEMRALEHDPLHTCQICNEPHLEPRIDNTVEVPAILPCGHIFGDMCISRWLEVSSFNKDCPACRRTMRYRACGCGVRAIVVKMASPGLLPLSLPMPEVVSESEMPEKCWVCRCVEEAYQGKGGELGEKLRMIRDRMTAEERALEGLKGLGAPAFFGGGGVRDFGLRAMESKGYWRGEMEKLSAEMMRENRAW